MRARGLHAIESLTAPLSFTIVCSTLDGPPCRCCCCPAVADEAAPLRGPTRLTEEQRWSIIALHKDNRSNTHTSPTTCTATETQYALCWHVTLPRAVLARDRAAGPRCTDKRKDEQIALVGRMEKFVSARQVRRKLDLHCSRSTIDRRLQEADLFGRVARHKRAYTAEEVHKRLSFAEGYKDWTVEQWSKVLFSDEKCFYGNGFCGRIWEPN